MPKFHLQYLYTFKTVLKYLLYFRYYSKKTFQDNYGTMVFTMLTE